MMWGKPRNMFRMQQQEKDRLFNDSWQWRLKNHSDFAERAETGTLGVHWKERARGECINAVLITVTLLSAETNRKVAVTHSDFTLCVHRSRRETEERDNVHMETAREQFQLWERI